MRRTLALVVAATVTATLLAPATAHASPPARPGLERALADLVGTGSAGALAQYRDTRGAWTGSAGVAELGRPGRVDPHGVFRIGSVTKTFTSVMILQLVGERRLNLTDPVERWLPGLIPGGDRITLRQLLGHTAGLWDHTDSLGDYPDLLRDRDKQWLPEDLLALSTSHAPLFEPGTSQAYSNTGYLILGMVLQRATGRTYQENLSQRITGPLRLEHTAMPTDSILPGPHAHGYVEIDGALVDFTRLTPSWAWSAGGMVSTATEVNKFFVALFAGRLLRPAEQRELFLPVGAADFYGLGVYRVDLSCGLSVWGHDGSIPGFETWAFQTLDGRQQFALSFTTARGDFGPAVTTVLNKAFCPN